MARVFSTFITESGKENRIGFNFPVEICGRETADFFYMIGVHVHDFSTVSATEMTVRFSVGVKAYAAVRGDDFVYVSQIGEQIQISIDSTETDVGKFFPDMHVYCIGRWMGCGRNEIIFNSLSLSAVF